MKIGILGPGAIGSLVGALLLRSGQEVIFIGKEKKKESINNLLPKNIIFKIMISLMICKKKKKLKL